MVIVYLSVAWLVGIVAAAFLLAPPIIILKFGIPFTYEMKRSGVLNSTAPASRYLVSFFLLLSFFGLLSWGMWRFFPAYIWAYVVGVALTLLPSLRKCGRNKANVEDFFETNAAYVNAAGLAQWRTDAGVP